MCLCVCVSMCILHSVTRQRLGKQFLVAKTTRATIEKLLDASFYMRYLSYRRKVVDTYCRNSEDFYILEMPKSEGAGCTGVGYCQAIRLRFCTR
jgi:hypothetical protein